MKRAIEEISVVVSTKNAKSCRVRLKKMETVKSHIVAVVVEEGVEDLPTSTFRGLKHLQRCVLPTTLKEIPNACFAECKSLREVIMPSVTAIGQHAFVDCVSLENVLLPEGLKEIFNGVFLGCKSLKTIRIPDGCDFKYKVRPSGVYANRKGYEFAGCNSLIEVEIPASLVSITKTSFDGCRKMKVTVSPDNPVWCAENGELKLRPDPILPPSVTILYLHTENYYVVSEFVSGTVSDKDLVFGEIHEAGAELDSLVLWTGKSWDERAEVLSAVNCAEEQVREETEESPREHCVLSKFWRAEKMPYIGSVKVVAAGAFDVAKLRLHYNVVKLPGRELRLLTGVEYEGGEAMLSMGSEYCPQKWLTPSNVQAFWQHEIIDQG